MEQSDEKVALSNCDKEPIHIPGQIQSFGCLLGFDLETQKLAYCSDNLPTVFEPMQKLPLGLPIDDVLSDREISHAIRGALGLPSIGEQRDRIGAFNFLGKRTDFSLYTSNGFGVIELEPDPESKARPQSAISTVRSMLSTIDSHRGQQAFLDSSTVALRHLTGHDRVMAYRFLDNGDGEVVAEARSPGIEPYLGLRYPASDIPNQVRKIMTQAPFRVIADIRSANASIVATADAPPLNLTYSHLRGVSPIHVEYLENMGVRSTMNISIIVRDRLWGIFAFHHYRPRKLTPDQRSICELFGHLSSLQLQQLEESSALQRRNQVRSIVSNIDLSDLAAQEVIQTVGLDFSSVVEADGVALVEPLHLTKLAETPSDGLIREIFELAKDDVLLIDSLIATELGRLDSGFDFGNTAGVLAMRMQGDAWLAFFRNETLHEVRWAGEKEKTIEYGPNGPRLTPRASFEEYREAISGRCNPWKTEHIAAASEICQELAHLYANESADVSERWKRKKQHQDLLIAELNHRVRNTLTLVRSIARQTEASSESLEQYIESFEQRIAALSIAHDLIGASGLQWARIDELVRSELKPFLSKSLRLQIEGPRIAIRGNLAPIVSLLFHELTSNAAKYGALSPHGQGLAIQWFEEDGGYTFCWTEELKEPIDVPEKRGFGFSLIERAVPYECNGKSEIVFAPTGLRLRFWFPSDSVIRLPELNPKAFTRETPKPAEDASVCSLESALVLEDNMVLAMEMENTLRGLGVKAVEALPKSSSALSAIERTSYDIAFLDINLGDDNSFEVALELRKRNVPTILVSGYDNNFEIPEELEGLTRLTKPVSRLEIAALLKLYST